jgi:microcystin-dependent protein
MSTPFLAEIRVFPFESVPAGWVACNGQALPIADNEPLFTLLGTTFGGDGITTFAVPDLRGRAVVHAGQGDALTPRSLGESGGSETVTLTVDELPVHSHAVRTSSAPGEDASAAKQALARSVGAMLYQTDVSSSLVTLAPEAIGPTAGGQPHNNLMPYLTLSYCLAVKGEFPSPQ